MSLSITINGLSLQVETNKTILEVAQENHIFIPTLCNQKRLHPFSSCFVCVVEINGMPKLFPACSTRIADGMVIETESERIINARKTALDLMLSDHSGDCVAPCSNFCPAHTDVQGYVAHIARGAFPEAIKLIKSKLPLPVVCGTICPNPCEAECRRGLVDDPIAIRDLKRFAAEYDLEEGPFIPETQPDTGKKVAIVGGGPAGLAAAYFSRINGHEVDLYEALPELGGMTRYGIPGFRLPREKLDAEIKTIVGLGVHVHCNQRLGKDFTLEQLRSEGADVVLIAVGAHGSKKMRIDNEETEGVLGGIDFLRRVTLGQLTDAGKKVAVIGGGDVAMDCARTARRLGAEVHLLYRRTQKEMPCLDHEQHEAEEEGVIFHYLTAPKAVLRDEEERSRGLEVIRMELGEPDSSGRRRPLPVEGSETEMEFDLVLSAIGQDPDLSCLAGESAEFSPEQTRWKTVVYDPSTMMTSIPNIFAAGDCAFGPDTVVRSVAEGKRAADAIHLFLNGVPLTFDREYQISRGRIDELNKDDFAPRFKSKSRETIHVKEPEARLAGDGSTPISIGFDKVQALAEASRCIACGCAARYDCKLREYATKYEADETRLKGNKTSYEVDERHPLIRLEMDKCINCGNCVRLCNEVRNVSALSFVERGFTTHPEPNFGDPLQNTTCDSCGMCVDVCPTGAINLKLGQAYGPWPVTERETICTSCGRNCELVARDIGDRIIQVTSSDNEDKERSIICADGRFSLLLLDQRETLETNKLESLLQQISDRIAQSKKTAFVVSPYLVNEEQFAFAQWAKKVGAELYYLTQEENSKTNTDFDYCKQEGLQNVALLNQLGAKGVEETILGDQDLIVSAGMTFSDAISKDKVVFLGNYASDNKATIRVPTKDPLELAGTVLANDGSSYALNGRESAFQSLETLVGRLVEKSGGAALIKALDAAKEPMVISVVPDARELAFEAYKALKEL